MNMDIPKENEEKESPQVLEEFLQLYRQLSAWERFQVDLYIRWLALQRRLGKIVWDWLLFQWRLEQKLNRS